MTDYQIIISKVAHSFHRLDIRRLVADGTPSRVPWRLK
jgi:hypothetical protein